ncbi:MAG: RuBisCO large subunit C-terminal-like domain-containing protein [Promethearchaeota archaeon]
MPKYEPEGLATRESIDPEDYVITTFHIRTQEADLLHIVEGLSIEQTTGTWIRVPRETDEVRRQFLGKTLGFYRTPGPNYTNLIVQIGFPMANFLPSVAQLMAAIAGNIFYVKNTAVRILDVQFPKAFAAPFKGPKFGVKGVRELLKAKERPLTLTMIKPCVGLATEVFAEQCYESAAGGIDIIKDDELMESPCNCLLENRITAVMEALDKAESETGEKTLYTINISDDGHRTLENAEKMVEMGANALHVNFLATGFTILRDVAEDPSIKVPVLAHPAGAGMWYRGFHGFNYPTIAKFVRLCGGDMYILPTSHGKLFMPYFDEISSALNSRASFYHIKANWPIVGGGVYPGMIPVNLHELGTDIILGAGGGVHAHPNGSIDGAKAMRQAVDLYMQDGNFEDIPKTMKELQLAVDKWGTYLKPRVEGFTTEIQPEFGWDGC